LSYIDAALAPQRNTGQIKIHGTQAFAGMLKAGQLAAEALDMLTPYVVPGVTTKRLDDLAYQFACDHNAYPATLFYMGFPASICTSINHVVCHGIPGPKVLKEGDIVNIDITLVVDGWHGDTSRMYPVGKINRKAERLIDVTYKALMKGLEVIRPGAFTGDIGAAIQEYAEGERTSVVRDFCGHGLGKLFHDVPNILHYGRKGEGFELRQGMLFTVEPMLNTGKPQVKVLGDGWTAVTRDKSLSAQFEHTIGVSANGCDIFTISPKGLHQPPYIVTD